MKPECNATAPECSEIALCICIIQHGRRGRKSQKPTFKTIKSQPDLPLPTLPTSQTDTTRPPWPMWMQIASRMASGRKLVFKRGKCPNPPCDVAASITTPVSPKRMARAGGFSLVWVVDGFSNHHKDRAVKSNYDNYIQQWKIGVLIFWWH